MTDDLHELSALYALDVLDRDERDRFEAHLAELRRAAATSWAACGTPPPRWRSSKGLRRRPALRGRIVEAARAERRTSCLLRPRRSVATSVAAVVAVAATAAAVGFGIWAATLHTRSRRSAPRRRCFAIRRRGTSR